MGGSLSGGSIRILWDAATSAVVTITGGSAAFTVGGSPITFPYTLTSSTSFDTVNPGDYTVSVTHQGYEVANTPDCTKAVSLRFGEQVVFAPSVDGGQGGNPQSLLSGLSATYVAQVKARGTATEHFAELMETLDLGLRSAGLGVVTDSTGFSASANRWPYLLGQSLATRYPAFTVRHHAWNSGNADYDVPTVIQTGAAGTRYATFASTSQACWPDSSLTDFTGELDFRIKVALDSWTPGTEVCLFSKFGSAGNRAFRFSFGTGFGVGNLTFECTSDGTTLLTHNANATWTPPANGAPVWLRCTFKGNDGSGNRLVAFYQSADGVTWAQIGTTVTVAGTVTLFNAATEFECGGRGGYANGGGLGAGKVYEVQVRNAINGPIILPTMVENWPLQLASGARALLPVSGAPVLDILNAAQSGASVVDMNTNIAKRLHNYSLKTVILASSHNDTGSASPNQWHTGETYTALWDTLLTNAQAQAPNASYVLMTENPRSSPATLISEHAIRLALLIGWARKNRLGIVDAYTAFVNDSRGLAVLNGVDGIHPSDADGSPLWRDTILTEMLKRGR